MQILLTGHKGFLGSHLMKALTETGHRVEGLDCDNDFKQWQWKWDLTFHGLKPDVIIHCGALADASEASTLLWQLNYWTTTAIGSRCYNEGKRLIFISSAAAYEPDTAYGFSKHCAEENLQHTVPDENLCILRPFNIWDFDESKKRSPSIIYKILTGQLTEVYSDCVRDFIHVSDVVAAIQQVVKNWVSGVFYVGTAKGTHLPDFVEQLYQRNPKLGHPPRYPKPPVTASCPIRKRLVAAHPQLFLPNWQATPVQDYVSSLQAELHKFADLDYSAEDH